MTAAELFLVWLTHFWTALWWMSIGTVAALIFVSACLFVYQVMVSLGLSAPFAGFVVATVFLSGLVAAVLTAVSYLETRWS